MKNYKKLVYPYDLDSGRTYWMAVYNSANYGSIEEAQRSGGLYECGPEMNGSGEVYAFLDGLELVLKCLENKDLVVVIAE